MVAHLRPPFQCLSSDNFVARGAGGHVFAISKHVVFKCATTFEDPAPSQAEEMVESAQKIESEKAVLRVLMKHPHQNIVPCILCVPEGIFLERLVGTIAPRINRPDRSSLAIDIQGRWIKQLASAVAWLEQLGYIHGDLRPANILLDHQDSIRLTDFDATVRRGEELLAACEPFCKLNSKLEPALAGPVTELFALGTCFYNISFGHLPFHEFEPPVRVKKLIAGELPSTDADEVFGSIIQKCWHAAYESVGELEQDIVGTLQKHGIQDRQGDSSSNATKSIDLMQECRDFLAINRSRSMLSATND